MAEAEFQSYVWWYIRRSYGPMKENGTISKRGYMMAHFSKFVRHGYIRIDATKNPETDVFVSAYRGENKIAIVAVNKKTSSVSQNFVINNAPAIGSAESWRTSGSENLAKGANINIAGGNFTANLPAQSVTTFVLTTNEPQPSSSSAVLSSSSVAPSSSSSAPSSSSAMPSSSSEAPVANYAKFSASPNFSVRVLNGKTLLVETNLDTVVDIYNLNGSKAATFKVLGTSQIVDLSLPGGVYFAKTRGMPNVKFVII
jgi:hypothetical protein